MRDLIKAVSMFKQVVSLPDDAKIYVVGDIHGEVTKLERELARLRFNYHDDTLYSVGDLIDRGEDSLKGLELITQPWFKAVRGNHEDMMIQGLCDDNAGMFANWILNGGIWYLKLDKSGQEYVRQLAEQAEQCMPIVLELQRSNKKFVICHADYPADHYPVAQEEQLKSQILWARNRVRNVIQGNHCHEIDGADLFVFGHTPIKEAIREQNCMWIDTGACYDQHNILTIIQV